MISLDANILLYAYDISCPEHDGAYRYISELGRQESVGISEFVLVEFYTLIRNPSVVERPLRPAAAVSVINRYREHPRLRLLGFPHPADEAMNFVWKAASRAQFARRRIYDVRLARILQQQEVTTFATANARDFRGLGFRKIVNPLTHH